MKNRSTFKIWIKRSCLILALLVCGLISYDALFNVHYDIDPTSMLAYLLGVTHPTLGMILAIVSSLLLWLFLRSYDKHKSA